MQRFINNWASRLSSPLSQSALEMQIPVDDAALLAGLGAGDHYMLTIVSVDVAGIETAHEIIRVTDAVGGVLSILRAQEGSTPAEWPINSRLELRLTAGTMDALRDAAADPGAVASVNGQTGVVVLDAATVGAATAAQGALADSAVQPDTLTAGLTGKVDKEAGKVLSSNDYTGAEKSKLAGLAAVASSGSYADLIEKPAIPSSAADIGAIPSSAAGVAGGVAPLDAGAKIPLVHIPSAAITDTYVVNTEAAMLALSAEVGDVAIRPDITSSFILQAEPASTLGNWQQILTPSIGGGAPVGSSAPQSLGTTTPGVSGNSSREDHVHAMPSAADVGAAPSSHVGAGGAEHAAATASAAGFISAAAMSKLDGIEAGATANTSTDTLSEGASNLYFTAARARGAVLTGLSLIDSATVAATDTVLQAIGKLAARLAAAFNRANHTGTQAISTVTGLQTVLDGKAPALSLLAVTATRSFALTDLGKYLRSTSASAVSLTIDPASTIAWPADAEINLRVSGAGAVTLVAGTGVTLNAPALGTLVLNQRMSVTLKRIGSTDEWDVLGQTVAA